MSGLSTFSLGDNNAIFSDKNTRWKPTKGKFRISFVALDGLAEGKPNLEASAPQFSGGKRYYKKETGFFMDSDDRAISKELQTLAGEPPKVVIATTIVLWAVDKRTGVLDLNAVKRGDYEVKNWLLAQDKYKTLVSLHSQFPLAQHDVLIDCTDEQFHKMTFAPCKDSVLHTLNAKDPSLFKQVIDNAIAVNSRLQDDCGQVLSPEKVREKLTGVSMPALGKGGLAINNLGGGNSNWNADDLLDSVIDD